MKYHWMVLLLGFVVIAWAESIPTSKILSSNTPSAETTVIIVKDKSWTIDALNRKAIEFLWNKGSMPKDLKVQARVGIFPGDKTTMCEFTYSQGFERSFWTVKVGYSGEIASYQKSMAKEQN